MCGTGKYCTKMGNCEDIAPKRQGAETPWETVRRLETTEKAAVQFSNNNYDACAERFCALDKKCGPRHGYKVRLEGTVVVQAAKLNPGLIKRAWFSKVEPT